MFIIFITSERELAKKTRGNQGNYQQKNAFLFHGPPTKTKNISGPTL